MVLEGQTPSSRQSMPAPTKFYLLFVPLLAFVLFALKHATQIQNDFGLSSNGRLADTASSTYFDSPTQRRDTEIQNNAVTADDEPLNIVLFYADDWTMKVMGKLNKYVKTPNIDKMADDGILFTNNCVTTSMCWISRGTMLTGTYASRHLFLEPSQETLFQTHPWNETVFPLLKANGYYTGLVGKWHAPQPEPEMSMAFDYMNLYFGWHWMPRGDQIRHVTDLNLEDSIDFLQNRPMDQKFALKVSFFATHAWDGHYPPYEPKNESKARFYNRVKIPRPKTATDEHWRGMPYFFNSGNEGRRRWENRFDPDHYQRSIKDLYRMATEVDFAVGKIIELLKEQGVYNKTLLIFTTDNGNMHGEHGLAEKWYPYEESIRVPLVIVDPRMHKSQHGTRNDEFTLSIDLAPTILGAAKISPSSFMQGRDIAKLYLPEKDVEPIRWRQDWFYEYNRGDPITGEGHAGTFWIDASFALITKEWKYIYWPQHDYEQIFHRSVDEYEEFDLLNSSQIQPTDEIYTKLKSRYTFLKKWVQTGHPV